MPLRGASILAAALLVLGLSAVASAQELKLRIASPLIQARTLAPIPLDIELQWTGPQALQGRLELACEHNLDIFARVTTDELVVPPGGTLRTRVYVPGLRYGIAAEFADANASFRAAEKRFDLGQHVIPLPPGGRRFVVLLTGEVGGGNDADFLDALKLERFDPKPDRVSHRTVPARLKPRDLPTSPLEYCAFDLVILRGESLSEMTPAQLDALLAWVRAGGALWAIPSGRLESEQTLFLDTLAAEGEPAVTFTADRFGRVTTVEDLPPEWIGRYRVDLGRAVISLREPDTRAAAAETTRTALFLWRVRANQEHHALSAGAWDPHAQQFSEYIRHYARSPDNREVIRFDPEPELIADSLLAALLPRQIRLVPLSVVVGLMIGFLVAVGPLDYFVLGALRKRKLTWVLFPALVIAFAVAMVWTAGRYMGGATAPRSLTVIDVGDDGREVRRFRLELRLSGRGEGEVPIPVKNGWVTPMDHRAVSQRFAYMGQFGPDGGAQLAPPSYEGRTPGNYTLVQSLNQWVPQLNRTIEIPVKGEKTTISWAQLESLTSGEGVPAELLPPGTGVYRLHGQGSRIETLLAGDLGDDSFDRNYIYHGPAGVHGLVAGFLSPLTFHRPQGLFAVVSQLSPGTAPSFEDFALLESDHQDRQVLVVAVRDGDNFTVYRKIIPANPELR